MRPSRRRSLSRRCRVRSGLLRFHLYVFYYSFSLSVPLSIGVLISILCCVCCDVSPCACFFVFVVFCSVVFRSLCVPASFSFCSFAFLSCSLLLSPCGVLLCVSAFVCFCLPVSKRVGGRVLCSGFCWRDGERNVVEREKE